MGQALPKERRKEPRLAIDELAVLHVLKPVVAGENDRGIPVTVIDMSPKGLGLRSAQPLPPGALVHIRIRETIVAMGEVRYSARVADEFYSGIRVKHAAKVKSRY